MAAYQAPKMLAAPAPGPRSQRPPFVHKTKHKIPRVDTEEPAETCGADLTLWGVGLEYSDEPAAPPTEDERQAAKEARIADPSAFHLAVGMAYVEYVIRPTVADIELLAGQEVPAAHKAAGFELARRSATAVAARWMPDVGDIPYQDEAIVVGGVIARVAARKLVGRRQPKPLAANEASEASEASVIDVGDDDGRPNAGRGGRDPWED